MMFAAEETPYELGFEAYGYTDTNPFNDEENKRDWWHGWFQGLAAAACDTIENS